MVDIALIIIGVIIIVLNIFIFLRLRQSSDSLLSYEVKEQKDKILSFESKLNLFPDLLQAKTAESTQKQFTEFTQKMMAQIQELIEKFGGFKNDLTKTLGETSQKTSADLTNFKELFEKSLTSDFDRLITKVETKLDAINSKVQENLSEGFKKTNETFNNVIERLTKIDEAQKKIDSLSTNVVSLQDIFNR